MESKFSGIRLGDIRVEVSELATEQVLVSHDRFMEFDAKKDGWVVAFGWAHWENRPFALQVGRDRLIVHPKVWEAMKAKLG